MSREERLLLNYMAMLRHLSADLKLKLIAMLSESIRENQAARAEEKDESWKSLYGAWSDTDDNLAEIIRESRMPNREIPSFD